MAIESGGAGAHGLAMGVCEAVRELAEGIDQGLAPKDPRHRICVELLRLMPCYRDIRDLSAWESAYQGALDEKDDETTVGVLLYEIFEFGRGNMYGAFNHKQTLENFDVLSKQLEDHGVPVPRISGLTGW